MKHLKFITILFWHVTVFGQMPKIHFNHVFIVIDSADLHAINTSSFFKTEFAAFSTRTTHSDKGHRWTGTYFYGVDNYVEILDPSSVGDPLGNAGIGFSVDGIGEIDKLKLQFSKNYKVETNDRKRELNGKLISWFTELNIADSAFFSKIHIYCWFMEYRKEYFESNRWSHDSNRLTRAQYLKHFDNERKNKIVKNFTGITFKVTRQERAFFTNLLLNCRFKRIGPNSFLSPDNFLFRFTPRHVSDRYSLYSIDFDANVAENRNVRISNHVKVMVAHSIGKIIFE